MLVLWLMQNKGNWQGTVQTGVKNGFARQCVSVGKQTLLGFTGHSYHIPQKFSEHRPFLKNRAEFCFCKD